MKAAYAQLADVVRLVINVEGLAYGHIYRAGIAVRRLHIRARSSGGHSWLHFGRASAIHGIMKLGAEIAAIVPPETPRTTYNIGMIDGGQSINSIATQASLWLDLRSESPDTLAALEIKVRDQVRRLTSGDLTFEIEVVGDRPAGAIPPEHPLVKAALETLDHLGTHASLETGSTDGNVPLAAGCPTVTIGITRGGNAHRLDEYIETTPIGNGLRQLIILALAACDEESIPA
jgi:di/tripeptidase